MIYMKPFPVFALRYAQLRVIPHLEIIHIVTSNKKDEQLSVLIFY